LRIDEFQKRGESINEVAFSLQKTVVAVAHFLKIRKKYRIGEDVTETKLKTSFGKEEFSKISSLRYRVSCSGEFH
jgi:hypothetical protein